MFLIGVVLQVAAAGLPLLVAGRAVAGLGVGGVSAILILYISEIAPRKVRGAIVSGYQFCITIGKPSFPFVFPTLLLIKFWFNDFLSKGLLLASAIDYAAQNRADSSSYRIPIAIQMVWALILGGGLSLLPESPRFYVRRGEHDHAAHSLSRLRSQPVTSDFVKDELAEIVANYEHERLLMPAGSYWSTWLACGRGSPKKGSSHLRRTILGTSLQMMQQWLAGRSNMVNITWYANLWVFRTGVNFVFYFGTTLVCTMHYF